MIKIENTVTPSPDQWDAIIRGMRNPLNSWDRSDSDTDWPEHPDIYKIGPNDKDLMMRLANGGPVHAKYRRMITVYVDITAPLYWWKEFDTYKVGTVANSCSTMHKIHAKKFDLDDFSHEHLMNVVPAGEAFVCPLNGLNATIDILNACRDGYLETKDKAYWWQMIQLLPSSYNQKRTIMLNYEVLNNIYHSRKNHKLDEWREFCSWIETELPYSEIITGEKKEKENGGS
jgi:hypothetical protein